MGNFGDDVRMFDRIGCIRWLIGLKMNCMEWSCDRKLQLLVESNKVRSDGAW